MTNTPSYVTQQGDTWDLISLKTVGSELYMVKLIEKNLKYREVVIFPAGVNLKIPQISTPISNNLPPWKR